MYLKTLLQLSLIHIYKGEAGVFGLEGMRAAYNYGDGWLDQLMEYLQGNLDFLIKYVSDNMPKIKVMVPEATRCV